MPWFTGWASPWLAVGRHHDGSPWSAGTTVLGLQPADDPHFYYLDNTGTLLLGPCGPGGGPYGRREHGRFRRSAGRKSRRGKGVKTATMRASMVLVQHVVTLSSNTLALSVAVTTLIDVSTGGALQGCSEAQ